MSATSAFRLLFIEKFEGAPLFKNQVDLVNELVHTTESLYFIDKSVDGYQKRAGNLRVYVSQLFSDGVRRAVTSEFKQSLRLIIQKKIKNDSESERIVDFIINDLVEKNDRFKNDAAKSQENLSFQNNDFFTSITSARYISVFSAREIRYELSIQGKNFSLAHLLIEDLIISLGNTKPVKSYRFNFPLPQTCMLFWVGIQKEIARYLQENRNSFDYVRDNFINRNFRSGAMKEKEILDELTLSAEILLHLSKTKIIRVFHLTAPIFLIPFIALNPNDAELSQTYCIFQNDEGKQFFHKLSRTELTFWRIFVWDNLRVHDFGKIIEYKRRPEFEE